MIYSYTPLYIKQGKNKGKEKDQRVLMNCDLCNRDFYGNIKNHKNKEQNICKSCIRSINGKKQSKNKGKKQNNPTHKSYGIKKGYSEEEAILKVRERKCINKEYGIKKGYSEEEAINLAKEYIKSNSVFYLEYGIKKGYSEEEAIKQVNQVKEKLSKAQTGKDRSTSARFCYLFGMKRGYPEEEAKYLAGLENKKIHKIRDNEKMAKSIREYFRNEEEEIKEERNKKIKENLKNKECKHSPIFKEYWIEKGYSEKEAINQVLLTKNYNSSSSKIEDKFIDQLEKFLNINFERNKYIKIEDKVFCPDAKLDDIIIEFNGTKVHLDERFYSENDINPGKRDFNLVKYNDKLKINYYKKKYKIYIIGEYDFLNNKDKLFNFLKEAINNESVKNGEVWDSRSL